MEYEQAIAAFAGHDTNAMDVYTILQIDPITPLCKSPDLDLATLARLAVDWAEHSIRYLDKHDSDTPVLRNKIRRNLGTIKDFISGLVGDGALDRAKTALELTARSTYNPVANHVAKSAVYASMVPTRTLDTAGTALYSVSANSAANIAAWQAEWAADDTVDFGAKTERAWQIRHLVHALNHSKAGGPWPLPGETP